MKARIQEQALALGFSDCRVTTAAPPATAEAFQQWLQAGRHGAMGYLERNAHRRVDPQQVLAEARSIIVLATAYRGAPAGKDSSRGIVARYAQHTDYHEVLGNRLEQLTQIVAEQGGPGTRSLWYVDTGPLLERDLAQRAGLGFAGKHTNLISRGLGNFFFLSEIITTVELEPDAPEKNRCGTCSRCLAACPTQAITAPFELDARRCISYLTIELKTSIPLEFRKAIGRRIYGCDICLEACPWNRFAGEARLMEAHRRKDLEQPDLLELLKLNDEGFKQMFKGTPMLRTKRRGLLRNVCVALGNVGNENALPELERALSDHEPLIAEHAAWAIGQIKERVNLIGKA